MWEYITGAILSPRATFSAVAKKQAWQQGFFLIILAGLINGATGYLTAGSLISALESYYKQTGQPGFKMLEQVVQSPAYSFISALLSLFVFWLVAGLLATVIGRIFHGQGTANGTLAALAFATAPYLIGKPILALLSLAGKTGENFGSLVGLVTTAWVLVLEILAIKESLQLNVNQAIGTYLLAGLGYLMTMILILFFAGLLIALFTMAGSGAHF